MSKPASVLPAGLGNPVLTFNEEFRAFTANATGARGWKTRYFHGDRTLPGNKELQFYADQETGGSPFSVQGGVLEITATRQDMAPGLHYRSGLLNSQTIFNQRHGYFEMRARLPAGKGIWPAFWLLPSGGGWPPEIDVVEMLGHEPDQIYASVHWGGEENKTTTKRIRVADTSADFHLYGCAWAAGTIAWYFDGREIARVPTPPGLDQEMYLLVNLAVGGDGSWPGAPDKTTRFPAVMAVDWVRAYRLSA